MAVHSMATPALEPADEPGSAAARRTRTGRLKMMLVLAVCAAPVIASYLTYFVIRPQGRTNYSELITPSREMPADLPLTSLAGGKVESTGLRGQWLLVVVGDAACDKACEDNLYLQRQLREALGREKERVDKLWLIPDAGEPRPEVLKAISTGTSTSVLRVPRAALEAWLKPPAGAALGSAIYVVDPMGQWMLRTPPHPMPAKFKADVDKLLRASAGWDQPGR